MDLDQLKDIWKGLDEPVAGRQGKQEILNMLKKRSQGPIAKMKRNLLFELISVIILYSALITHYLTAFDHELQSVAWFLLVIGVLFLVYYFLKNKLLNEMQQVSGKVRFHLERQVITLEKYVRIYMIAGVIMVPVCLAFFGWIFYNQVEDFSKSSILFPSDTNSLWKVILAWLILTLALIIPVYFAYVWILNKMYGKHIDKLKQIIKEMSEE